jgi:ClpP class serine protease
MELLNFVWIFFIFVSLAPLVRQKIIESARRKLMVELEQKRGTRVIALIHRQESMSILGFPVARFIDIQDSEEILRAIKLTNPQVPIDLILHTPGGLVLASAQIAAALSKHPGKVTVFVPHYAMSGGTLLALAADEIVMDENAVLGPVDPQIGQYPAASILKVLEQKDPNKIDDETMILADMSRKAINQVKDTIVEIGCCHYKREQAERIAETLATGYWTHDYPISVQHAKELGLTVTTDMPVDIYKLMNLYPQAQSRRPSVDYVPLPYRTPPALPDGSKTKD